MNHDAGAAGPAVAHNPRFDTAVRGYEKRQVDERLARLNQETNRLTAGLRQEREQARAERDDALRRLEAAQKQLDSVRTASETTVVLNPAHDQVSVFGNRLQNILATAEQEANAAAAEAREAAQRIRAEAAQQAEAMIADARRQADGLLTQARQDADRLTSEAVLEADGMLERARGEAAAALDAARREESQTRSDLAELVRRREQVRRQLTDIGLTIGSLLADDVEDGVDHAATDTTTAEAAGVGGATAVASR